MLTQAQQAKYWGAQCYSGPKLAVTLYGGGVVTVRPVLGDAVLALDAVLRSYNYHTRVADTGGYVCRHETNSTKISNHGRAIAIDINWTTNPYGHVLHTDMPRAMVNAICAIRTNNGQQIWNWGGNWSGNKDAMHFEVVCKPSDIATGVKGATVTIPIPDPPINVPTGVLLPSNEDEEMPQWFRNTSTGDIIRVVGNSYSLLTPPAWDLDSKFGAQYVDLDNNTFHTEAGSRQQVPGQAPIR